MYLQKTLMKIFFYGYIHKIKSQGCTLSKDFNDYLSEIF
jgi:hypothetical protein